MKNTFTLTSCIFYLLTVVCFFVVGILFASLIDAAKGQGLAGGAIVLGYGFIFALVALVTAIFSTIYVPQRVIKKINRALSVLAALSALLIAYRVATTDKPATASSYPSVPTKPAADLPVSSDIDNDDDPSKSK